MREKNFIDSPCIYLASWGGLGDYYFLFVNYDKVVRACFYFLFYFFMSYFGCVFFSLLVNLIGTRHYQTIQVLFDYSSLFESVTKLINPLSHPNTIHAFLFHFFVFFIFFIFIWPFAFLFPFSPFYRGETNGQMLSLNIWFLLFFYLVSNILGIILHHLFDFSPIKLANDSKITL